MKPFSLNGAVRLSIAGLSLLATLADANSECSPCLFPIAEVVGWPSEKDPRPALSPLFLEAFAEKKPESATDERSALGKAFKDSFFAEFGSQVTANVESIGVNANAARTFVASLQILRASSYSVSKIDGTTDHHYPVTLTLSFTNPLTGEVLASLSKTRYEVLRLKSDTTAEELNAKATATIRQGAHALAREIIKDAKQSFKPFHIKAKVQKVWNGYYILDRGQDDGFAIDNELEDSARNSIKIVHAAPKYSVAVPGLVLGAIKAGTEFGRYSTQKTEDIKKPRAVMLSGSRLQDSYANQLFGDLLLDAKAGLTLTPVNNDFDLLLKLIDTYTDIGQANVKHNRLLPQLFLRIAVIEPIHFEVPTNISGSTARQIVTRVSGALIDTSGRVVYGNIGEDTIQDVVTSGQGFSIEARKEIGFKNALLDLAKKFASDLKLKEETFPLEGGYQITDPKGLVPDRIAIRVFRGIGRVEGVQIDDVLVPIATGNALRDGKKVVVADVFPVTAESPKPEAGDKAMLLTDGKPLAGVKRYQFCNSAQSNKGEIKYEAFVPIAFALAARHLGPALYADRNELRSRVSDLVDNRGFHSDLNKEGFVQAENCLEPLYKFRAAKICSGANCDFKVDAGSGFMVAPVGVPAKMEARKVQFDLSQPASAGESPLLAEIVKQTITSLPVVIQRIN